MATLIELILKREDFRYTLRGITFEFIFTPMLEVLEGAGAMTYLREAKIYLRPEVNDDYLLDCVVHEILEVFNYRMEWKLEHDTLNQVAFMLSAIMLPEVDDGPVHA